MYRELNKCSLIPSFWFQVCYAMWFLKDRCCASICDKHSIFENYFTLITVLEAKKSFTDSQLQSNELSGYNNLPSFLPPWQLSYLEL